MEQRTVDPFQGSQYTSMGTKDDPIEIILKKRRDIAAKCVTLQTDMIIKLYENNPNEREVRRIGELLRGGGIVIVPTDTLYSIVCSISHKKAVEKIARMKGMELKQAHFALLCGTLSEVAEYVRPIDKETFGLLRRTLPGPYTYILEANNKVPRNYQNANKTIGIRVPDNAIVRALIEEVGEPLVGTSVYVREEGQEKEYLTDPELIHDNFGDRVDAVVDGGIADSEPSTVVAMNGEEATVVRQGKGTWPIE